MSTAEAETGYEAPSHWEVVLRAWKELALPEGWRAEIIEGDITVMAPPEDEHGHIVARIRTWLITEKLRSDGPLGAAEVFQHRCTRSATRQPLHPGHSGAAWTHIETQR